LCPSLCDADLGVVGGACSVQRPKALLLASAEPDTHSHKPLDHCRSQRHNPCSRWAESLTPHNNLPEVGAIFHLVMMPSHSNSAKVRHLLVETHSEGQRLDNWLVKQLKGVPRSHLYKIIRDGQVRVNGGRVRPTYRLETGDSVRIPPVRIDAHQGIPDPMTLPLIGLDILYEDSALLVLNKTAGISVHGGTGIRLGLIESLRLDRPKSPFLELVHRIDRPTSGCLMIAKSSTILRHLHSQFRSEGGVKKNYRALVHGEWNAGPRTIDLKLSTRTLAVDRVRRSVPDPTGQRAISHFRPVQWFRDYTLVDITLGTGRMHQIRAHAAAVGHPVVGDHYYGDRTADKTVRQKGFRRMWLHAQSIGVIHPESGAPLLVNAPVPEDLTGLLKGLDLKQ
jgi:23S rRNA pseudouridine955/2504/2580 synthase